MDKTKPAKIPSWTAKECRVSPLAEMSLLIDGSREREIKFSSGIRSGMSLHAREYGPPPVHILAALSVLRRLT